ncbi:RDD family protein [Nocardiopsis suaedae]|uniref:RDD family protein n=1 Tax=Nocardiopsis suaedae TaxID=3018444 RepID=A0ABT4TFS6_9ACTN|nr:RDD family protein [Nocardiopsis suaedae]MDA2803548.1 RDD family protein [Nocardiopsis suaedae]
MAPEYGRRVVARLIDAVLAQIISMVLLVIAMVGMFVFLFTASPDTVNGPGSPFPFFLAVSFAGWFGYETVFLKAWGATPGKRAMGLRVVPLVTAQGVDAGGLPWGSAVVRAAVWSLPLLLSWNIAVNVLSAVLWLANGLWPLRDRPLGQALHDKAARTRVIDAH